MRLILVRHGRAGRKSEWTGDDRFRPLDATGRRQAQDLVKSLIRYRPTRAISSPYLRCQQTPEPLATNCGLGIEPSEALRADAGDRTLTLVQDLIRAGSSTVVLCTHREDLVTVLAALSGEFAGSLGHRQAGAKGSAWVLDLLKRKLVTVKYVAPGT